MLAVQVTRQVLAPGLSEWLPLNDMAVLQKTIGKNGQQKGVAIGVRVDDGVIEMRRRFFGVQMKQDAERWTEDSSKPDGRSLPVVFAEWAKEAV